METLVVDRRDGVVTVSMNRPQKKNAVTPAMTEELTSVFREVARSTEDRVMVLTGEGGDFSSGADLTPSTELTASSMYYMRRISDLALALHEDQRGAALVAVQHLTPFVLECVL